MSRSPEIEFVPLDTLSLDEQIQLLGDSFEKPIDKDWYRWKHVEGPWGPSDGVVALDSQGPAALYLYLPWQVQYSGTHTLRRALDSGTLPRAQRRGVFKAMGANWINEQRSAGQPFAFCSATDAAANVHVKNGGTVLLFPHAYAMPFSSSLGIGRHIDMPVADAVSEYTPMQPHTQGIISTKWAVESLVWRFDRRSGLTYKAALLGGSPQSTGLVYRLEKKRGLRILVRVFAWGDRRSQERLVASVARSQRAPLVLDLAKRLGRPRMVRGRTALCVWTFAESSNVRPDTVDGWDLTLSDVEGVM